MAAISRASICLSGSHAGVEIGADGPSQMALEDLAMMRAVHGSTVLYPGDATSAAALVEAMADLDGISYMRTTRGAYPVLYDDGEQFKADFLAISRKIDKVWFEQEDRCRKEAFEMVSKLQDFAQEGTNGPLCAGQQQPQHIEERGERLIGDAVGHNFIPFRSQMQDAVGCDRRDAEAPRHAGLADEVGMSGTTDELLAESGIDADAIAAAARSLLA